MKVLLVSNTTWNIKNFRLNIIQKFLDEGHDVEVIAPVDEYISYQELFPSISHHALHTLDRDSINPFKDIRLTRELLRLYKKIAPGIIIHYTVKPNIYGGFAARLAGIPSVAVVTGLGYAFIHNGLVKQTTKQLYRLACKYHQKIIFENFDDKQLFNDLGIVDEIKSVAIKGCGVNTDYYKPAPHASAKSGKTIFTFIGRLLYDKGVREFISAARAVKIDHQDVEFWLVGELDEGNPSRIRKDDLVEWVRDKTVIYQGAVKDIRTIIGDSDCIVLPSYREGLPRVLTEALSMARPIITTDTAGCRETVDEGVNGFLVPVKNSAALATAMLNFIALSNEKKQQMGIAGRKKALKEFDDRMIAETFYNIIQD